MLTYGHDLIQIQLPVNRRLAGTFSWINMLHGVDRELPKGWVQVNNIPIIDSDEAEQNNRLWAQIFEQTAA